MGYFTTWKEALVASFQELFFKVADFLPNLIGAIIVLVIGLIIAAGLGRAAKKLTRLTKVDEITEKLGFKTPFEKAGFRFSLAGLISWLVKWFLIIVLLIAVADILKLPQITEFLNTVALYLPNVVIAVVILLVGMVAANFIQEVVQKAVAATRLARGKFLAGLAKWAILIFSFMAALIQLRIAAGLVQTLFTGLVAALALAAGLAFGLAGKDQAMRWIEKLRKDLSSGE